MGSERLIEMVLNPVQRVRYIIGLGLFDFEPNEVLNQTKRYDLISRSFEFVIENPSSWANQECGLFHISGTGRILLILSNVIVLNFILSTGTGSTYFFQFLINNFNLGYISNIVNQQGEETIIEDLKISKNCH